MVRYTVSIRHFLTLYSVNKILFDTFRHFSPARYMQKFVRGQPNRPSEDEAAISAACGEGLTSWSVELFRCLPRWVRSRTSAVPTQFNGALYIMVYYIVAHHLMVRYI